MGYANVGLLTQGRKRCFMLWTAWIVIGSYFEEIDLVVQFGDAYREYQRNVPMLVPLLKWPKKERSTVNKHYERN